MRNLTAPGRTGNYLILLAVASLVSPLCPALVLALPIFGAAQGFAVLGHEAVTNGHSAPNATTRIYGDLGVSPGTEVTGFYPDGAMSGGTIHINDGAAQLCLADATTAYNTLAGLSPNYDLTGQVLGSPGYATLTPGVYRFASSAQLTGGLTLDFQGDPDAMFVFQVGSTLTTASDSFVNVINGNSNSGVYWQVGSSATLGTDAMFAGNILALATVSLDPRAQILCGRAFGLTGAVTLIDNAISNNNTEEDFGSGRSDFGSYGFSGGSVNPVPEPSSILLLCSGLAGFVAIRGRSKKA